MTIAASVGAVGNTSTPPHVSVWEAAELCRLKPCDIQDLCNIGKVEFAMWGDVMRVDLASLREFAGSRLGVNIP